VLLYIKNLHYIKVTMTFYFLKLVRQLFCLKRL